MNLQRIIFLSVVLTIFLVAPDTSFAVEDPGGFVTCSGADECNFCSLVDMTNSIVQWLITVGVSFAILLLSFSGFRLITAGGDASALENAKKMLISSFIGILIMLAGWTIVDTFLKVVAGGDLGVWNVVECGGAYDVADATDFSTTLVTHDGPTIEPIGEGVEYKYDYIVYTKDEPEKCRQLVASGGPTAALCQASLDGVVQGSGRGNSYIADGCTAGGAPRTPAWINWKSCSPSSAGQSVSVSGGSASSILPCKEGAPDRRSVPFLGGSATVHKSFVASLRRIDSKWRAMGAGKYPVYSVGSYNCRTTASGKPSFHAYGMALDINPVQNPHTFPPKGLVTDIPPSFVKLFTDEGWGWGGNWNSSKDAMHFSKGKNEQGDMRGE